MELIHKRDVIRAVRDRWLDSYKHYGPEHEIGPRDRKRPVGVTRKALAALDLETCTAADVDAAIGVEGWADNKCDDCDGDFPVLVRVGQAPGYDARWWEMCPDCLGKASALLCDTPAQS